MSDPLLSAIKAIAASGSEFGADYDRGTLEVIDQIETLGYFVPNRSARIALVYLTSPDAILDDVEADLARKTLQATHERLDAKQYFRGICHTEDRLSYYSESEVPQKYGRFPT